MDHQAQGKLIEFNEEQRTQIIEAARTYLMMRDDADLNAFVDHIEHTGQISAFGVGSLLDYSHLQNDNGTFKDDLESEFPGMNENNVITMRSGAADGVQASFCCFDTFYRGTKTAPGVTIGNEKIKGARTDGGLLITQIDHLDPNIAANFVERYLQRFNEREYPQGMPIYKFELMDIHLRDGSMTKGLVCVADDEGPLYIRNVNNDYAKGDEQSPYYLPTNEEGKIKTGYVIAHAAGSPTNPSTGERKPAGKVTDMDYLRNTINGYMERDLAIPQEMVDLYEIAGDFRADMDAGTRMKLQDLEFKGARSNTRTLTTLFAQMSHAHNLALAANDDGPSSEVA